MWRRPAVALFGVLLLCAGGPAAAQTGEIVDRSALKVCADPNNLPFSDEKKEGYENKIAEALAHDLGKKIEYTFFPQRMGFVRMTLRARNESTLKFKCDLIIGVPKGYEWPRRVRKAKRGCPRRA